MNTTRHRAFISLAITALAACATPPAAAPPTPETPADMPAPAAPTPAREPGPEPPVNPNLPPVPKVTGPLAIKVIYPRADQLIQSRDSNFVFGSIGNGDADLWINNTAIPVYPNGAFMAWLPNPPAENPVYDIFAKTGSDSARLAHPITVAAPVTQPVEPVVPAVPDTIVLMSPARYAELIGPAAYASDTDRVVTGYALTGGLQRWFLLPHTVVKVIGKKGADYHVRLDTTRTIRIEPGEIRMLDSTAPPPPQTRASAFRIAGTGEWTDVIIPMNARPAHLVEVGPNSLTLTLYATKGPEERQITVKAPDSSHVTSVSSFASGPQMQYIVMLNGPVYGYQPLWEDSVFTFRVRNPPAINPADPLRGLKIAIDPGHPPVGATGPTGFWEPEGTLPVGLKVRELLQAKGVDVFMTRTTPDPVDLNLRGTMARRENAHAFVSIHLNALPDGVNPFGPHGTATYHYHLHSSRLAAAVQTEEVKQMSLPDNGVKRSNFAVVRGTWMPMILVEGAVIMMPDQEAALRTPEYQARYAQGIVDGLEAYFRSLASAEK